MKSKFALLTQRGNIFKEQSIIGLWKRYNQYRTIITAAGIVHIRNASAKTLMATYAMTNDKTQFQFIRCWIQWSTYAKVLNQFISWQFSH